jgi:hypothetical protein
MKRLNDCPFALTSGGRVLLNAAHINGVKTLQQALDVARDHGQVLFVGIELGRAETRAALERVRSQFSEAAAYAAGRRLRQRREGRRRA